MNPTNEIQDSSRFNIIFEKLEEAKKEQDINFNYQLEMVSEANQTISLFKEFQDSMIESSFTLITRS